MINPLARQSDGGKISATETDASNAVPCLGTDLLEELVGQKGSALVDGPLRFLQSFRGHEGGTGALRLLGEQLDDHGFHVEKQDVHVRVGQVGLHRLHHQCIVGVFRQVALLKRKKERKKDGSSYRRSATYSLQNVASGFVSPASSSGPESLELLL